MSSTCRFCSGVFPESFPFRCESAGVVAEERSKGASCREAVLVSSEGTLLTLGSTSGDETGGCNAMVAEFSESPLEKSIAFLSDSNGGSAGMSSAFEGVEVEMSPRLKSDWAGKDAIRVGSATSEDSGPVTMLVDSLSDNGVSL